VLVSECVQARLDPCLLVAGGNNHDSAKMVMRLG
jgi:hypothetical protein